MLNTLPEKENFPMPDRPIDGFNPILLDLTIRASTQRVEVKLASHTKAMSLRARLYYLRQKILASDRPDKDILRCTIFRVEGTNLIAEPADADVADAIRAALEGTEPPSQLSTPDLSAALAAEKEKT
jgi:hypothetical protein